MSMDKPIIVGAVLYNPKVSVIWDIIGEFFQDNGCPIDTVFYTNYELQVEALLKGRIKTVEDLRGKTVAVGAKDSPQATLIPLGLLQRHGLQPGRDVQVQRFDLMVGKHGDHIGGELAAFKCLAAGEADASALVDLNWQTWTQDGTINPNEYTILATTEPFDHCCFTVHTDFPPEREQQFLRALYAMSYDNPKHREMMDLEGLKAWVPGRTSGYGLLHEAVERQHFFAGTRT